MPAIFTTKLTVEFDFLVRLYRTVASALNSLSAVTSEDIIATGLNIKMNPAKGALYIKWMSLG